MRLVSEGAKVPEYTSNAIAPLKVNKEPFVKTNRSKGKSLDATPLLAVGFSL